MKVAILFCTLYLTVVYTSPVTFSIISPSRIAGQFDGTPALTFDSTKDSLVLNTIDGRPIFKFSKSSLESDTYTYELVGRPLVANETLLTNTQVGQYLEMAESLPTIAKTLGALGIKGPEMQGAMGIYKMAMGMQRYIEKHGFVSPSTGIRRSKLDKCGCDCPNSITACPSKPPQCCDCLGQCGACGSCWDWVCNDCCYQLGCCGHDICCYESSIGCLFPGGLECGKPYSCSGMNTGCCTSTKVVPNEGNSPCNTDTNGWCECSQACCTSPWKCTK